MPSPKCFVSLVKPPAKRKPFVNAFNHRIDLLLPTDVYDIISQSLLSCPSLAAPPVYHRLVMPLGEILEPTFFNTHIKSGNILLLSRGRLDVENIICLSDGVLRMNLDTETYERAGLQGQPAKCGNGSGAMKRRRFVVELNLRSPSYLTGSKSFNRLKRACENVLNQPQVFLFADLSPSKLSSSGSGSSAADSAAAIPEIITKFPVRTPVPVVETFTDVRIPAFRAPTNSRPHGGGKSEEANYNRGIWRDWVMEIHEYLSLLLLPSGPADRLRATTSVDPYLSTYAVDDELESPSTVTKLQLVGLIPAKWAEAFWENMERLLESLTEEKPETVWAAMVIHGFDDVPFEPTGKQRAGLDACGNAYSILKLPGEGGAMTWEIVGGGNE
ncbi:ribonuclease P 40kDa subunit-domain-containing protein [Sphaerosporella brunnea]|uniref:Ribonuclease P 40kDa subunit-domain-containing protein n=1 Tax=Sphaerosporella brunnea TaxID=1250544 RepID=A0A5J5F0M0_9PEZI|nr:ribonuclease P 40kDa subunit-domain-containing protein [Sphaerosporella brunnea]